MRLLLFTGCVLAFVCATGLGQELKKKDDAPAKKGDKAKEITEVAGKTLGQWIHDISSKDPSRREHAMRMILEFEPEKWQEAIPGLLTELEKHKKVKIDLSVRIHGAVALGTILSSVKNPDLEDVKRAVAVLKGFCKDEQVIVRTRAVQALAQLAPLSNTAIEEVIYVAKDRDTWEARLAGLQTLTRMITTSVKGDPPTTRVLEVYYGAFEDNSMQVRITAVRSVAQFAHLKNKLPGNAQERLLKALDRVIAKDVESAVHIWAHLAVITLRGRVDTEQIMAIASYLDDRDPAVRIQAAQYLGMIGQQIEQQKARVAKDPKVVMPLIGKNVKTTIVSRLHKHFEDDDPHVIGACMTALAVADPDYAVMPVAGMLENPDPSVRVQAAATLSLIGPKARPAETHLVAKLYDSHALVVASCINALVQIDALGSMPALQKLSEVSKDENIKDAAAQAIKIMQKQAKNKTGPDAKDKGTK